MNELLQKIFGEELQLYSLTNKNMNLFPNYSPKTNRSKSTFKSEFKRGSVRLPALRSETTPKNPDKIQVFNFNQCDKDKYRKFGINQNVEQYIIRKVEPRNASKSKRVKEYNKKFDQQQKHRQQIQIEVPTFTYLDI